MPSLYSSGLSYSELVEFFPPTRLNEMYVPRVMQLIHRQQCLMELGLGRVF